MTSLIPPSADRPGTGLADTLAQAGRANRSIASQMKRDAAQARLRALRLWADLAKGRGDTDTARAIARQAADSARTIRAADKAAADLGVGDDPLALRIPDPSLAEVDIVIATAAKTAASHADAEHFRRQWRRAAGSGLDLVV